MSFSSFAQKQPFWAFLALVVLECNTVFPDKQHVASVRCFTNTPWVFVARRSSLVVRKLELMGEHTCQRWHRDHYCGRAIITYNLCGTEYTSEVGIFVGLPAFFSLGPLAWRGVDFVGDGFFTDLTKGNRMVKITTTWGIWFSLVLSILHANPKFWCVYLVFLVSQSLRNVRPNLGGKIQGSWWWFFLPPELKEVLKRGHLQTTFLFRGFGFGC